MLSCKFYKGFMNTFFMEALVERLLLNLQAKQYERTRNIKAAMSNIGIWWFLKGVYMLNMIAFVKAYFWDVSFRIVKISTASRHCAVTKVYVQASIE